MSKEFFAELVRVLRRDDITVGEEVKGSVSILVGGQTIGVVFGDGFMYRCANNLKSQGKPDLLYKVAETAALVYQYVKAVEKAPLLVAETLNTEYRLLCEYNGTVLAGKRLAEEHGYQFVTWDRSPDSTALNHGHYYKDGYEQAKLDFASRSGLVQEQRQFTDEQLVEIYDCVQIKRNNYVMEQSQADLLQKVRAQIEEVVPGLAEEQREAIQQTWM